MGYLIAAIIRLLTGAGGLTDTLRRAYEAKLSANSDAERIAAEREIERIGAAVKMADIASADRWSATSIGRYLIVVPFGLWWSAVYLIQIINPWLGLSLVVVDVPVHVMDMARILVPAILIADAGALVARKLK